jgi:ABC-type nitrate/sulfonate/bicarbonate transport system substrate-binding protein
MFNAFKVAAALSMIGAVVSEYFGGSRSALGVFITQEAAQSQFAGYYAALANGFYEDEGLDVTIQEGAVDIVPQQVVAAGDAEFGIAWVPKMLAS